MTSGLAFEPESRSASNVNKLSNCHLKKWTAHYKPVKLSDSSGLIFKLCCLCQLGWSGACYRNDNRFFLINAWVLEFWSVHSAVSKICIVCGRIVEFPCSPLDSNAQCQYPTRYGRQVVNIYPQETLETCCFTFDERCWLFIFMAYDLFCLQEKWEQAWVHMEQSRYDWRRET